MPTRDSYANGVPNWADLTTTDPESAKVFYGGLFGWEYDERPTTQGVPYIMAMKGGSRAAGMMQMPPDMHAGGMPSMWSTYLAVDDVDATCGKVPGAGGQVTVPPMDVMTEGRMAMVDDPTGAMIGLWQAKDHVGAGVVNEHGSVTWNEVQTSDPAAAAGFYAAVVGWDAQAMEMPDGGQYTIFTIGEDQVAGAMEAPMPEVPPHWSTVFAVDDANSAATTATELGGSVLVEPFDMFVGQLTVLADPTGAVFQAIALTDPSS